MDGLPSEDVAITGVAAGGEGVGRLADGRVVFVRGALPGERVRISVSDERKRFARGALVEVVEAAPERAAPPCPQVAAGCGGCDWQHVALAAQRELKAGIVTDALRRIGRVDPPEPDLGPDLPAQGWRTTVRAVIDDEGRAGFRLHHAHDPLAVGPGGCLVAHPLVDEILREGHFPPPVREVTVRAGAATGERLVVCSPAVGDSRVPGAPSVGETPVPAAPAAGEPPGPPASAAAESPGPAASAAAESPGPAFPAAGEPPGRAGVLLVGADELAAGHRAWIHEVVAGRRWRISAGSFFQARPDGAEALVNAVAAALGDALAPGATVADLYSGVGLFAGVLGERTGGRVVAVESNRSAVADAKINLADLDGARIVRSDVRRWHPSAADVVVADPSRHGLGAEVVPRIGATGAAALALVSCDPGALGRDAGLLAADGWELVSVRLVDVFPHTSHVEVVTGWIRPN
jgi:23S rRNA (uracil1939-C5)-methyltransferase